MQARRFTSWLRQLNGLTRRQRAHLMHALRPVVGLDRVCEVIDGASRSAPPCPACQGERSYRHGHSRGLQRYRCRACGKTFTRLSATPLARLRHRGKWLDYLAQMLDAKSVRAAADAVAVHRNTSFRWRHRFLALAKHDRPERLAGIAEADELFLLESPKGSRNLRRPPRRRGGVASTRGITHQHDCILVARDRTGQTVDAVTGRGAVTDAHAAYQAFAREAGISHQYVNLSAGERMRGAIHIQNINRYHRRLRQWLARFNGVASRYLPNYLGWRWALDGQRIVSPERFLRAAMGFFHT